MQSSEKSENAPRESLWLNDALQAGIREPDTKDLVQWADGLLKIPSSTRCAIFDAEESPWLLEPMRALSDEKVTRVDIRAPAGSAKSLIGEIWIADIICRSPGMTYYVWQTDDDAKDSMEDRVLPMIEGNQYINTKLPVDRHKKRAAKILFPHMSLYAVGANKSAAQSKRVRYLIMEEPHLYEPGMMKAFERRTEGVRNAKILTLSTGSILDDESDLAFRDGTCEEWQVSCPNCKEYQFLIDHRDRLRCDRNKETMDENGEYVWGKLIPTIRYNCDHCGQDWPTDADFRRTQAQTGKYVATNPNADPKHRSFHYTAQAVHWIDLHRILQEKLKCSRIAKQGALEPLMDYVQKWKAEAWDDSPGDDDVKGDIARMYGAYIRRDKWPDEMMRFLTVDNQAGRASRGEGQHRWYVCRAYGQTESRLIDCGKITTWEELEELRIKLEVIPAATLVDMAHDTQMVQSVCVRYGWQGLFGDNQRKKTFPHHIEMQTPQGPKRITHYFPFSPVTLGHVGIGTDQKQKAARYFFWAQQTIKNLYHRLYKGLVTYKWSVPSDVSPDYARHHVEYRKQMIDPKGGKYWEFVSPKGRDNHLEDCDQMNLVAALMHPKIRQILYTPSETDGIEENNEDQPT